MNSFAAHSKAISVGHFRYIRWLRGFRLKTVIFITFFVSQFSKETWIQSKTNIEVCPESLGAMLEYWYIERGRGPVYSCLFSDLASEWQRGWRRPCYDTDLTVFVVQITFFLCQLVVTYTRKAERSVSMQDDLQPPHAVIGQVTKHTNVKWPIECRK